MALPLVQWISIMRSPHTPEGGFFPMKIRTLTAIALVAGMTFGADQAQPVSVSVKSAVSDAGRPAPDKERDANRKPGEVIAFSGMKAGDVVADINPGGGYFTRIFSKTVGP